MNERKKGAYLIRRTWLLQFDVWLAMSVCLRSGGNSKWPFRQSVDCFYYPSMVAIEGDRRRCRDEAVLEQSARERERESEWWKEKKQSEPRDDVIEDLISVSSTACSTQTVDGGKSVQLRLSQLSLRLLLLMMITLAESDC